MFIGYTALQPEPVFFSLYFHEIEILQKIDSSGSSIMPSKVYTEISAIRNNNILRPWASYGATRTDNDKNNLSFLTYLWSRNWKGSIPKIILLKMNSYPALFFCIIYIGTLHISLLTFHFLSIKSTDTSLNRISICCNLLPTNELS